MINYIEDEFNSCKVKSGNIKSTKTIKDDIIDNFEIINQMPEYLEDEFLSIPFCKINDMKFLKQLLKNLDIL